MSRACRLGDLLQDLVSVPATLAEHPVTGLVLDSRRIGRGDVFVALAGARNHGLDFLAQVRAQGAVCVLAEAPLPAGIAAAPDVLEVPALRAKLGVIANRYFSAPSQALAVVGVTGTNGKTSTVQLLAQALEDSAHGPCGHIGTLGLGLSGWLQPGERTTPDVLAVHAALDVLRARGARSVAMEVSSHALDQGRVDGVHFAVAVFTNLTRDHLDYHQTMQAYAEAKARLFTDCAPLSAVINLDDPFAPELLHRLPASGQLWPVSATGQTGARLRAESIELNAQGLNFVLSEGDERCAVSSPLLGRFNVDNLLGVAGVLRALGLPLSEVAQRLHALQPVRGRMNRIVATTPEASAAAGPLVVVDYAHTPDALEQALRSLRGHTAGQLICVFGCGGERDRGKRPQMAQIAESLADQVIVTDDNPRCESGDQIAAEIMAGFAKAGAVRLQRDRAQAIRLAIAGAAANDTVLIAGKGHETYQEVGAERRPFDDAAVAAQALQERAA